MGSSKVNFRKIESMQDSIARGKREEFTRVRKAYYFRRYLQKCVSSLKLI